MTGRPYCKYWMTEVNGLDSVLINSRVLATS